MSIASIARLVFLIFFGVEFLLERVLSMLNARHVRANANSVPDALAGALDAETHRKSVSYALARNRFGHVVAVEGAALKLVFLFSGILPHIATHADTLVANAYFKPIVFLFLF